MTTYMQMFHSVYLYEYPPLIILVAANSRSASSNTMQASLPPSSICNGIIPAFFDMAIPVSQPPVKLFQNNRVSLTWTRAGETHPPSSSLNSILWKRPKKREVVGLGRASHNKKQTTNKTCQPAHFDMPRVVEMNLTLNAPKSKHALQVIKNNWFGCELSDAKSQGTNSRPKCQSEICIKVGLQVVYHYALARFISKHISRSTFIKSLFSNINIKLN